MENEIIYDAAIIGGGLAGLTLSIQLAKAGFSVVLFEKEKYPFHKVCGEYISNESNDFLKGLGFQTEHLPQIRNLVVTSPSGNILKSSLYLGGFGVSRYTIDFELSKIAKESGVIICEETKATDVSISKNIFQISAGDKVFQAKIVAATFGKRSNLDVKWSRNFTKRKANKLNNYIGVKYHIKTDFAVDSIALHNFENGYCGISKIEEDKCCLCYLTTAKNLKDNNNSIAALEKNILHKNPHLKKIFTSAKFIFQSPVTISQISFERKSLIQDNIIMIGDAAGMITPLCGNGMSMAMHGSKIAFDLINDFLQNKISRTEMEFQYQKNWNKEFSARLYRGRILQSMFGKTSITNLFILMMKLFPALVKKLITATHGKPF